MKAVIKRPRQRTNRLRSDGKMTTSWVLDWRFPDGTPTGRLKSKSYKNKVAALADRDKLVRAAEDRSTIWDLETGLPLSMLANENAGSWADYTFAHMKHLREQSRRAKPTALQSKTDGLQISILAFMDRRTLSVGQLRSIRAFVLDELTGTIPEGTRQHVEARKLLARRSLQLTALGQKSLITELAEALAHEVPQELHLDTQKQARPAVIEQERRAQLDAQPARRFYSDALVAINTEKRRLSAVSAVFTEALADVHSGLDRNPLDMMPTHHLGRSTASTAVTPGMVASPIQVWWLASTVSCVGRTNILTPSGKFKRRGQGRGSYFALIILIGFSGLRTHEAYHLRVEDLHLPNDEGVPGTAYVRGGTTRPGRFSDSGRSWEDGPAKTGGREVPLIPDVVRVLKCHLSIWRPSAKATDRVFVNRAGKPIEPQRFAKAIREAAEELFPESSPLHDMNPYDLRHTSVTLALSAGIAPAVVAAWHGHSVATMYSKYAGFFGDATRSNIDLLTKELARLTSFSGQQ